MRQLYFLMCALAATLTCAFGEGLVSSTRQRLNLDEVWQFQLDPEDQGEKLGWGFDRRALSNTIRVPGIWQTQGFGEPRGQLRHDYQGRSGTSAPSRFRPSGRGARFGCTSGASFVAPKSISMGRRWAAMTE